MLTIALPAGLKDDLHWEKEEALAKAALEKGEKIFWLIDFKFDSFKIALSDTSYFLTFSLALEHFTKTLWPLFKESTLGICIYKGDLQFSLKFLFDDLEQQNFKEWVSDLGKDGSITPFHYHLFCAGVFGEYLDRLISFLPDTAPLFALFDTSGEDPAKTAFLLSKERFSHVEQELGEKASIAICLPSDHFICSDLLMLLEDVIDAIDVKYRVIPESLLTEEWNGVETLFVFSSYLSSQGIRKLKGFEASGGKVITVGEALGLEGEELFSGL